MVWDVLSGSRLAQWFETCSMVFELHCRIRTCRRQLSCKYVSLSQWCKMTLLNAFKNKKRCLLILQVKQCQVACDIDSTTLSYINNLWGVWSVHHLHICTMKSYIKLCGVVCTTSSHLHYETIYIIKLCGVFCTTSSHLYHKVLIRWDFVIIWTIKSMLMFFHK